MRVDIRILLVYSYLCLGSFNNAEKNESVFVPTKEWQTVKEGTPMPRGRFHIRHNFKTGITEAKLMDDNETEKESSNENPKDKSLALHPDETLTKEEPKITKEPELKFPIKELKARLKSLKYKDNRDEDNDENKKEETKRKYKDYDTLKKELKALNLNITTDAELLTGFFKKFQTHKTGIITGTLTAVELEELLDILNNLEFLVHQIDNAYLFVDMGGMSTIVSPCLNGTNNQIKAEALRLLGAAAQSNPKVQIRALENDFIQKLLHMLSTNTKPEVKSRCLFALSAIIRQFPAAQKVLVDHGGLEIFGKILADGQLNVQMKTLMLVNDLTIERRDLEKIQNIELRQRKSKEYTITDFEHKLVTHKYCQRLSNLIVNSFKEKNVEDLMIYFEDQPLLEILFQSMLTMYPSCKHEFNEKDFLPIAEDMKRLFKKLEDDEDVEKSEMFKELGALVEKIQTTVRDTSHVEL